MEETVGKGWKTATYVLGAAVLGQFVWWDRKCPQVLRGKGYSGMQGLRGVDNSRLVAWLNRDEPASWGGGMAYNIERNELCDQARAAARAGEPVRSQIAEAARGARFPKRANTLMECVPAGLGSHGLRSANSPASHKVTTQYRAAATRKNVARAVARGNERAADAARDRARAEFNRLYAAASTNAEAKTVEKAYRWLRK